MIAVADTGFVVSVINQRDKHHQRCKALYATMSKIYLPQSTLAEVAYLLRRNVGPAHVASLLEGLSRSRYELVALTDDDLLRTAQILRQYADSRVDFVDASVAAIAERLGLNQILTLDYRDFSIIRPRHSDYFELLPTSTG